MEARKTEQWLEEMEEARKVQSGMLPQSVPSVEGYDIAAHLSPALNVGGDFYDFTSLPDGSLSLIVGDAVGHGISAALLMAVALTNYRYVAPLETSAASVLSRLDRQLGALKTPAGHASVTATCCVLDPGSGRLSFSLAAMQPLLVRGGKCTRLETEGMRYPLGIVGEAGYGSSTVSMEGGDAVLIFSDGIPEAVGTGGELYGFRRLERAAAATRGSDARGVVDAILADLQRFVGEKPQEDDITLVVLVRESRTEIRPASRARPTVLTNEIALRAIFQEILSPAMVDRLIAHPSEAHLDGAERDMSVLFTDLRGFTEFMETVSLEAGIEAVQRYFDGVAGAALRNDGMLDKIVGDMVMALFGVPVDVGNHAANACRAALEAQRWLEGYSQEICARGLPELKMGVGVNTGRAWVGMFGHRRLTQYTPWGECINLGARLERTSRTYGVTIVVGASTQVQAGASFVTRELDSISLRSKALPSPQSIYELVAKEESELTPGLRETLARYAEGLAAYRERRWDEALASFNAALEASGGTDGPSRVLIERTRKLRAKPPAQPWDGVYPHP